MSSQPSAQVQSEARPRSAAAVDPRVRILKDLEADRAKGEFSFPTFMDATMKVRRALDDPYGGSEHVAQAVSSEPLLAAKLVHVANSAALNASGKAVSDVKEAIMRVGFSNVRAIATSVAMGQLIAAKEMQPFLKRAEAVWHHSLDVAAIAFVLARRLTRLNPDEALFAGLVHDVGRFYLLSKVPKYPELTADLMALEGVMDEWHVPIGHSILRTFGLKDDVLRAVEDHERPMTFKVPGTLSELLIVSNVVSKLPNPLNPQQRAPRSVKVEQYADALAFLETSSQELTSLVTALRA